MKRLHARLFLLALCCLTLCCAVSLPGCAESSASVDGLHSGAAAGRFILAEEPSDVQCVIDVREQMPVEGEVAVLGRIGGVKNPWTAGEASFIISDPSLITVDDDDHECGDNCPFCAKKRAEQVSAMAFVQIVDDNGKVVRVDAQKLLGLKAEQMIVAHGAASLNRAGHLVIAARAIYVRE